jgi:uncharacterized protein (TIGR00730 family)
MPLRKPTNAPPADPPRAALLRSVCVFCGSKSGDDPAYARAARQLGQLLAQRALTLVYGGGQIGLMGALADAALQAGGRVVGVIPQLLASVELVHPRATQMHVVESMHARKAQMTALADAFIALPGGYGTLEELLETITWAQLGIHRKPIGLLNVQGYYDPLVQFIQQAVSRGFVRAEHLQLFVVEPEPATLLDRLAQHTMPEAGVRLQLEQA